MLTLIWYLFHPCVSAVARKSPRSLCQKCRWQVTPKHAYTLDLTKLEWADYAAIMLFYLTLSQTDIVSNWYCPSTIAMERKNEHQGKIKGPTKITAELIGRIKNMKEKTHKKTTEWKNERENKRENIGIGNNGYQLSIMWERPVKSGREWKVWSCIKKNFLNSISTAAHLPSWWPPRKLNFISFVLIIACG